ncbi:MAG: hypothetical protein A2X88_06125 [Deltaproteobacteria bacterium GWC2_65_14]|nr:MAG: hypothetical protein A2X88_06125 [Deltaproteobacteria bacterium GWC2_65_14]
MLPRKALLVDDNILLCWGLYRSLTGRGFVVHTAGTLGEALTQLASDAYGLIFLDVRLPNGSGFEITDEIRRTQPLAKVIVISCDASPETLERARAQGAFRFLEKPFDLSDITELIDDAYGGGTEHRRFER